MEAKDAVTGVCLDSRAVQEGDLYAALPGARTHGAGFAQAALQRGARAVLTDAAGLELLGSLPVPVLLTEDPRAVLGAVSAAVCRAPATRHLRCDRDQRQDHTCLLRSLLRASVRAHRHHRGPRGGHPDSLGPDHPEAPGCDLMARMAESGVSHAAMEVSSHSLGSRRIAGLRFAVSKGFTNLTQDHLDLHGGMEGYFHAKAALFTPNTRTAPSSRWTRSGGCAWPRRPVSPQSRCSPDRPRRAKTDWASLGCGARALATASKLRHRDGRGLRRDTSGNFNVSNAALALAMLLESGVELGDLQAALDSDASPLTPSVPGRMQVVHTHPTPPSSTLPTTDALVRALESRRDAGGQTIVVFGATGERDTSKRPIMGAGRAPRRRGHRHGRPPRRGPRASAPR